MKHYLFIGLLLAGTAIVPSEGADKAKQKAGRAKPAAPAVVQIPAGAKETAPGTFSHVDAEGKKWLYRKTPFGIAKIEDKPAPQAERKVVESERQVVEAMTAKEEGDLIRFTRPGPFGDYQWTKSKSELNDLETAAWKREQERRKDSSESERK
jgi:hypothetical protein